MTSIAPTLQGFFTERLISQRHVSPATIASYRDSLKLLLAFTQQRRGMVKSCGRRVLSDHAATLVSASSGRSMSTPFSNFAPARTRATRCGPLT